ncbi:MAG: DUF488 domain-containing protein [Candidatus Methanomethylicaceae archaeon]
MCDEKAESTESVKIWSMGYGSLSETKFLSIIKENNIDFVIDVRRWPTSKLPHFKKENLDALLRESGVNYIWMGDKLGGFRKEGYAAYMNSQEFENGIFSIISLSERGRVCLLCLEPDPKRCHRRYITERLSKLGFKIVEIQH